MTDFIYFGRTDGFPIGPYHPDEINAQARAREFLGIQKGAVYRVEAKTPHDARRQIDEYVANERRMARDRDTR